MRFLPQWESCPALRHELQEPQHSGEYLWVWDPMADQPACILNLACLILVQMEHHKVAGGLVLPIIHPNEEYRQ